MHKALKDALTIAKTIFRNGYDAHIINAPLHEQLLPQMKNPSVDIACAADADMLSKIFPGITLTEQDPRLLAILEQDGITYRFYNLSVEDAGHPELSLLRLTPSLLEEMGEDAQGKLQISGFGVPKKSSDRYEGFESFHAGEVKLSGLPDETLKSNYLLAIRALRFSANYDLPIEANTWMAIVRASTRVFDYVPASEILAEWQQVAAESLHIFVRLLYEAHILQSIMPEIAALAKVKQIKNEEEGEESVLEHTLACMKYYPDGEFHYDWLGTIAMMFHDIGKLYTGEYVGGVWSFYQHHRVGAGVTRKILRRLHCSQEAIDLLSHLVENHMYFKFMLADRGIRRFKALEEYPRLIAMARAEVKARNGSSTAFNHNMKYLERADTPEALLEPFLNGNEIMEVTGLPPGPEVGRTRTALLKAQKAGKVQNAEEAKAFVKDYAWELCNSKK